jgi:uncharacterized membrane protein
MNMTTIQSLFRWLATLFFLIAGALHFVIPQFYQAMMPPFIPFQEFFIVLTGIAEMAGAVGIQIVRFRMLAGRLMIALLLAVFPANIYVAIVQPALPDLEYTPESMWWRLLLQPLFIAWIWWVSVKQQKTE